MVNINFYRVLLYKIVHYFAKYLCILYIYFINGYRKIFTNGTRSSCFFGYHRLEKKVTVVYRLNFVISRYIRVTFANRKESFKIIENNINLTIIHSFCITGALQRGLKHVNMIHVTLDSRKQLVRHVYICGTTKGLKKRYKWLPW